MLKRNDVLKDTGIKYTLEEVQAINNIHNYIRGYNYNEETAYNDIKLVGNCYKLNPGHRMLSQFDNDFLTYLNKKVNEVETFDSILLNPQENTFLQDVMKYYYLPFRYSKNPTLDKKIISTILNLKHDSYDKILFSLSFNSYGDKLAKEIHNFIAQEGIEFESLGKDARCGWVEKYPDKDQDIIDRFNIAKDNYHNEDNTKEVLKKYKKDIGNYAELEFFKYLNKNRKENEQILWVSRFVGDGFGYDIMVCNNKTKEVKLYEVKGSISLFYSKKFDLTLTESNILRSASESNVEYHIVKLFFDKDKTKIYEICKKGEKTTIDAVNDTVYYILKDENNKKLTYELF